MSQQDQSQQNSNQISQQQQGQISRKQSQQLVQSQQQQEVSHQNSRHNSQKQLTITKSSVLSIGKIDHGSEDDQQLFIEVPFVIKQLKDCWLLSKLDNSVPRAQIQYLSKVLQKPEEQFIQDLRALKYQELQIENKQSTITNYYKKIFSDEDERETIYQQMFYLKETSSLAQSIVAALDEDNAQLKHIVTQEDNLIAILFAAIDKIKEKDFKQAIYLCLKSTQLIGFQMPYEGCSIAPCLTGFSLIAALFDIFPDEKFSILNKLSQDVYFKGGNLKLFFESFWPYEYFKENQKKQQQQQEQQQAANQNQRKQSIEENQSQHMQNQKQQQQKNQSTTIEESEQDKIEKQNYLLDQQKKRVESLQQIVQRLQSLKANNQKYADYLVGEFARFLKSQEHQSDFELTLEDEPNLTSLNQESDVNIHENLNIRWNKLKAKIHNNDQLSRREEDEWRDIAFNQMYREALILLGEKYLICDQNIKNAINCYKLLFCLGEQSSATLLYLTLTYDKNFKDAIVVSRKLQSQMKEANCLINLNKKQEAYKIMKELVIVQLKQDIQQEEEQQQNEQQSCLDISLNKLHNELIGQIFFTYQLMKCVENLKEETDYFAALTAYQILISEDNENQMVKLLVLSNLLEKSSYFNKDAQKAKKIVQYIHQFLQPKKLYEYITWQFVERKYQLYSETTTQQNQMQSNINQQAGGTGNSFFNNSQSNFNNTKKQQSMSQTNVSFAAASKDLGKQQQQNKKVNNTVTVNQKKDLEPVREHWTKYIQKLIEISTKSLRKFCELKVAYYQQIVEQQKQQQQEKQDNQSQTSTQSQQQQTQSKKVTQSIYSQENQININDMSEEEFFAKIGQKILFRDSSSYSIKYVYLSEEKINRRNNKQSHQLDKFIEKKMNIQLLQLVHPKITLRERNVKALKLLKPQLFKLLCQLNPIFKQDVELNYGANYNQLVGLGLNKQSLSSEEEELQSPPDLRKLKTLKSQYSQSNRVSSTKQRKNEQNENMFKLFNFRLTDDCKIKFEGPLIQSSLPYFFEKDLHFLDQKSGYFTFNNQKFSVFELVENKRMIKLVNYLKQSTPFCLNIFGFFKPIQPEQHQQGENQHQEITKSPSPSKNKDNEKQISVKALFETYKCTFPEYLIMKKQQQKQQKQNNEEQKQNSTQPQQSQQQNENTEIDDNEPSINAMQLLYQIITIVSAMHIGSLSGLLSLYGDSIFVIDDNNNLKLQNVMMLLAGSNPFDYRTVAPELMLKDFNEQKAFCSDIWAIGVLLYRIYYGYSIYESDEQKQIEKEIIKFRDQGKVQQLLDIELGNQSYFKLHNEQPSQEQIKLIKQIIQSCLTFDPDSRPQAFDLMYEIHNLIKGQQYPEGIFDIYKQYLNSIKPKIFKQKDKSQTQDKPTNQQQNTNEQSNQKKKKRNQSPQQQQQQQQQPIIDNSSNKQAAEKTKVSGSIHIEDQNQKNQQAENSQKNQEQINQNELNQKNNNQNKQNDQIIQNQQMNTQLNNENQNKNVDNNEQSQQNKDQAQQNQTAANQTTEKQKPQVKFQNTDKEQKQGVTTNNQQQSDDFKIIFKPGGGVIMYSTNGLVLYYASTGAYYILFNNKLVQQKDQINDIDQILSGHGLLYLNNDRILVGDFAEKLNPQQVQMISCFQNSTLDIGFDTKTRLPNSNTQQLFVDDDMNKQHHQEELDQIKNICSYIDKNSNKMFRGVYGNLYKCDLSEYSLPMVSVDRQPMLIMNESKILLVKGTRGFLFNLSDLVYSVVYDMDILDRCNLDLIQSIELMSNSHHIKQHLLDQMHFSGVIDQWKHKEGYLMYDKSTTVQIDGFLKDKNEPYVTRIIFENGDFYEGSIQEGIYHGQGAYGNKDKIYMSGNFENGILTMGSLFYYDNILLNYDGEVTFDENTRTCQRHGFGKLTFKNGDEYEGFFQNDMFEGQGKLMYQGGKKGYYNGQFKENQKEGNGIMVDAKGNVYEGSFKKGKKHGYGEEKYVNQDYFSGNFIGGKKEGIGIYSYAQGEIEIYEGDYNDDKKCGVGVELLRNGCKYQVKYYKDQLIKKQLISEKKPIQQQADKKVSNDEQKKKEESNTSYKTYSFF